MQHTKIFDLIFLICIIFIVSLTTCRGDPTSKTSRIDKAELENLNYHIEIEKTLKIDSTLRNELHSESAVSSLEQDSSIKTTTETFSSAGGDLVRIRSVHGQMYECQLPDSASSLHHLSHDDRLDDDDDETNGFVDAAIFFESSAFKTKPVAKPQFNFTFINERVKAEMNALKKSELCIYRVNALEKEKIWLKIR